MFLADLQDGGGAARELLLGRDREGLVPLRTATRTSATSARSLASSRARRMPAAGSGAVALGWGACQQLRWQGDRAHASSGRGGGEGASGSSQQRQQPAAAAASGGSSQRRERREGGLTWSERTESLPVMLNSCKGGTSVGRRPRNRAVEGPMKRRRQVDETAAK